MRLIIRTLDYEEVLVLCLLTITRSLQLTTTRPKIHLIRLVVVMSNSEVNGDIDSLAASSASKYGTKFKLMTRTDQIHELQTLIRDAETSRSHFKASFD